MTTKKNVAVKTVAPQAGKLFSIVGAQFESIDGRISPVSEEIKILDPSNPGILKMFKAAANKGSWKIQRESLERDLLKLMDKGLYRLFFKEGELIKRVVAFKIRYFGETEHHYI